MNNNRYFELLQKYTELQKAFDDTLEMNRKFGTENVRLEKENEQLQKNNKHIRDLIEAERQRQEECDDVHLRDIATLEKENKRAKVLLKAVLDLLQKQKDSHYVLNLLEATSFYDEAECDGYCLFDDIENFLNFGS